VVSDSVVDIFDAVGLDKPNIGLLSDKFLAQVKNLPEKNLAVELLERLLEGEIKSRFASNVVQDARGRVGARDTFPTFLVLCDLASILPTGPAVRGVLPLTGKRFLLCLSKGKRNTPYGELADIRASLSRNLALAPHISPQMHSKPPSALFTQTQQSVDQQSGFHP
jgi:hypothetical protein